MSISIVTKFMRKLRKRSESVLQNYVTILMIPFYISIVRTMKTLLDSNILVQNNYTNYTIYKEEERRLVEIIEDNSVNSTKLELDSLISIVSIDNIVNYSEVPTS